MLNLVDLGGGLLYLLIAYVIYKRGWFYSFYSFIKFLILAFASVAIANFISSRDPINLPFTKLVESLILELALFVSFWKIINFKKPFFKTAQKVFNIDRFIFTHGFNKVLNLFPALAASSFIIFFLFTILVSASTNNIFVQRELEKSKVIKPFAYKIYSSNLFEGVAIKLDVKKPKLNISLENIRKTLIAKALKPSVLTIKNAFSPFITIPALPERPTASEEPEPYIPPADDPVQYQTPTPTPNIIPTSPPDYFRNPDPTAEPIPTLNPETNSPTATPIPVPANPPPTVSIEQIEQDIFRLTNEERVKKGVAPLVWSDSIGKVARTHSQDMNSRNFFDHTNPSSQNPFQRLRAAGISFGTAGENIAAGPNAEIMVRNWMNSSGHRANILSPSFRKIGIGVATTGRYGYFATQNFTN